MRIPSLLLASVAATLFTACGGGGGGTATSGSSGPSAGAQSAGLYEGTLSGPAGVQHAPSTTLLTPDHHLWSVFSGTGTSGTVTGLITGVGTIDPRSEALTVPLTTYIGGTPCTGTATVSVSGSSISVSGSSSASGSSAANGTSSSSSSSSCAFSVSVTGSTPAGTSTTGNAGGTTSSTFSFGTPATLAELAGSWQGYLGSIGQALLTVSANGALTGTAGSCNFRGSATPDTTFDYFAVQLTLGTGCGSLAGESGSGYAAVVNQTLVTAASNATHGAVFIGKRPAS